MTEDLETERPTSVPISAAPNVHGVDAAAAAARRVTEALLRNGDATGHDMDAAAARLNAIADTLEDGAPAVQDRLASMWDFTDASPHDPVTGPMNAMAPPIRITGLPDGSVTGDVVLGLTYQGPPGSAHGGVSALLLDHALGIANYWAGRSGMTVELQLRYLRRVPLFEPLTVTAQQVAIDERRLFAEGSITAGGRVCVTAKGSFATWEPPRPGQ